MARQRGQSPSGNIFGTIRQAIDADAQRRLKRIAACRNHWNGGRR